MVIKWGRRGEFIVQRTTPSAATPRTSSASRTGRSRVAKEETIDRTCPKCAQADQIRFGRFKFVGCTGLPRVPRGAAAAEPIGMKCPDCSVGDVVQKFSRKRRCSGCNRYPDCTEVPRVGQTDPGAVPAGGNKFLVEGHQAGRCREEVSEPRCLPQGARHRRIGRRVVGGRLTARVLSHRFPRRARRPKERGVGPRGSARGARGARPPVATTVDTRLRRVGRNACPLVCDEGHGRRGQPRRPARPRGSSRATRRRRGPRRDAPLRGTRSAPDGDAGGTRLLGTTSAAPSARRRSAS